MQPKHKHSKKLIFLYCILFFFSISILYTAIDYSHAVEKNNILKADTLYFESELIDSANMVMIDDIQSLSHDVLYLADILTTYGINQNDWTTVKQLWLAFSSEQIIYDQIRYLDVDGNELIRIDYAETGAAIIAMENLQNKSDRYYFQDALQITAGEVSVSKLDLNIEDNVVEEPITPMLRFSTPVFDSDGTLQGIVVTNYSAQNLLDDYERVMENSNNEHSLINPDGYWIYNCNDSSKEWTFMYDETSDISFANEYPEEWAQINGQTKGIIDTSNGYFIFESVETALPDDFSWIHMNGGNYYSVIQISNEELGAQTFFANNQNLFFSRLGEHWSIYCTILFLSFLIAVILYERKKLRVEIKYFSEFDAMTNTYNRRAGLKMLQTSLKSAVNNKKPISVCFLDINGLKEVNDTFGHDTGDELILTFTGILKATLRQTDFIARLGGDEFLIVFIDTSSEQAEEIWQRIKMTASKKAKNPTENTV